MPIENRLLGVKSLLLFLTHKVLLRKQQSSWNSKRYFPTERNPRIESGTYNAMSDFRIFVFVAWKTCCEREVKLSNLIKPLFVDLSHTVTSRFLFFSTPLLCCSTCYLISFLVFLFCPFCTGACWSTFALFHSTRLVCSFFLVCQLYHYHHHYKQLEL